MTEGYCHTCYRTLAGGTRCAGCEQGTARTTARLALIAGVAGVPLLLAGVQTLNVRLCIAGAVVSGCAAIAYAVVMLRSG